KAGVLSIDVGELGLEEDVLAVKMAGGEGVSQCLADRGFVVVAALVGGVDAAKAGADGHAGEEGGIVFLPRRAVEEGRDADIAHAGVAWGLPVLRHRPWGTRAATRRRSGAHPA